MVFYLDNMAFKDDLELDFSGDEVEVLIVNDLKVEIQDDNRDNFIFLPRACLQKGKNRVSVMYHSKYNNIHSGLISFIDNTEQFLFTDFEPYYANWVFPCFDQPNLKAKMKLTVIGPEAWRVLSNETPIAN
jgi:aminopeptidase N